MRLDNRTREVIKSEVASLRAHALGQHLTLDGTPKAVPLAVYT